MTYDDTRLARITTKRAIREMRDHDAKTEIRGKWIVCSYTYEKIVKIGRDDCVSGRTVLDWLGY